MRTNGIAKAALAAGLSASVAAAAGCSKVLVPTYTLPAVKSGWQVQLVAGGLTKPRSIEFDSSGALLIVESGKGITRHTLTDNGGTCLSDSGSTLVISQTSLNHGLALSTDGKTLYASTVDSVYAWDYDASKGTVGATPRVIVNNMGNNDLVTRTLLIPKKQDGTLVVSRGSADANMVQAAVLSSGMSQIRAFNLTNFTITSKAYDFNTNGVVLGWGLRNSVGVGEHPVTGGIYAVENSVDGATRDGIDVHQNNPGEELNYLGTLDNVNASQSSNYGYPHCYAVWDVSEIPDNSALAVGDQFAVQENSTLTDKICAQDYVAPRLTFPAHYAPLDIKFTPDGSQAFVTFHGSFDKTDPVGYLVASIDFNARTGDPVAAHDSTNALTEIMTNANHTACPANCFRPVGLAFDSAGRLWMTSDTTGELYVLQQVTASPTASASGTIVTATSAPNAAGTTFGWETRVLGWSVVAAVGGWLAVF